LLGNAESLIMRDCITDKTRLAGPSDAARIVGLQTGLTIAGALFTQWQFGEQSTRSVLYGGGIAIVNSLIFWIAAQRSRPETVGRAMAQLYGVAALRLLATLVLFAVAFGMLNLDVLPVIGMFAASQLAHGWVMARRPQDRY
jgi:F0F1-type ATP synthase assembly protein I